VASRQFHNNASLSFSRDCDCGAGILIARAKRSMVCSAVSPVAISRSTDRNGANATLSGSTVIKIAPCIDFQPGKAESSGRR
jgi:hypothetical protein